MAKKDKRPVWLVRKGLTLVPDMVADANALCALQEGQRVSVEIKHGRRNDRLRAYWAMLHEVNEAVDAAPTTEQLHALIKLQTGFVDLVRLGNGMTVAVPGSIAFDSMSEDEMVTFFERAKDWLAKEYQIDPMQLEAA